MKTADFGYDGKGQMRLNETADVANAVVAFTRKRAVVEKFIDFKCELSVIVTRNEEGQCETFPVAENIHTKHILDFSIVPARVSPTVQREAAELAVNIAKAFGLIGILAVELFMTDDGTLLVNEMAPRTHNSGHWTLDACVTTQFEQQIRAVAGLPLGDTSLTASAAVMVNVLGDAWSWNGDELKGPPNWSALLAEPRAKLHLYGKSEPRPGRKMGHFTITGSNVGPLLDRARVLKAALAGSAVA